MKAAGTRCLLTKRGRKMVSKDFFAALEAFESEYNINITFVIESLEQGISSALRRQIGEGKNVKVNIDTEKKKIRARAFKTVIADDSEELDEDKMILLAEAKEINPKLKVGDVIEEEINLKDFNRIAAQTVKQVLLQKIREAKKHIALDELEDKEGEIITANIRRIEDRAIFLETGLNNAEGVLLLKDQIPGERYQVGQRIKVLVKDIRDDFRGPQMQVTRTTADFVKKLFELEVPEISSGDIIIKNIVREAGYRTKIAIYSADANIDPIGACVGSRGARVNAIVEELGGEKIDIVPYSDNPDEFIAAALSPARIISIDLDDANRQSRAIVQEGKLSLAIGKGGLNVRLASRLTGWKIDVKTEGTAPAVSPKETPAEEAKEENQTDGMASGDIFGDLDSEL